MTMYRLKAGQQKIEELQEFQFESEGSHAFSPQRILLENPNIIFNLPELELYDSETILSFPEYSTRRGNIDLLLIGENAEIVIVETKLLRNPESTRQVVAQIIDYIKAFSEETIDDVVKKIRGRFPTIANRLINDLNFSAHIQDNIRTGNFKVAVVGDYIHPNVLGMIESIHSAPHLSFTIYLIDLHTCSLTPDEIIIKPGIVTSTLEVERSVIRIIIEPTVNQYRIEAQTPEPKGKGTKPILTWDEYIANVTEPSFRQIINDFRQRWTAEVDDSINMGQTGFSAGILNGDVRRPIQYLFDSQVYIISEKVAKTSSIPTDVYSEYLADLKQSAYLHDKYIASGKIAVQFSSIDEERLSLILNSALKLAVRYKSSILSNEH